MDHGKQDIREDSLECDELLAMGGTPRGSTSFGSEPSRKEMSQFRPPEVARTNENQIPRTIITVLNRFTRQQYFESLVILAIGLSFLAVIIAGSQQTITSNERSNLAGIKNLKVSPSRTAGWFKNPVLDRPEGDPFIYYHTDKFYYMAFVTHRQEITVFKSKSLTNWNSASKTTVYNVSGSFANVWAPKIHFIHGQWCIYFSMVTRDVDLNQNMFVIVAMYNSKDPLGPYGKAIRISAFQPNENLFAMHGTVMEYSNGRLYIIYSGISNRGKSSTNLYIAPMSNPTKISGTRVLLRETSNSPSDWDRNGLSMPHQLKNGNRTNIVFTAFGLSGTCCLGLMGIDNGEDPLIASNWWKNNDGCVFWGNEQQNVFDIQYGAFTKSRDLTEDWMIYCAAPAKGNQFTRTLRLVKFTWNVDGTPVFPRPNGLFTALPLPSGENI